MKKVLAAFSMFLLLGISSGIVMAYLVSEDTAENTFTASEIEIELTEEFDPPEEIHPGTVIPKRPEITNVSKVPCYVRMTYYFSDSDAEAFCEPIQILDGWTLKEDGYYYWKDVLQPQESTGALFDKLEVKTTAQEEELCNFDVLVYAEAVQATEARSEEAWRTMR